VHVCCGIFTCPHYHAHTGVPGLLRYVSRLSILRLCVPMYQCLFIADLSVSNTTFSQDFFSAFFLFLYVNFSMYTLISIYLGLEKYFAFLLTEHCIFKFRRLSGWRQEYLFFCSSLILCLWWCVIFFSYIFGIGLKFVKYFAFNLPAFCYCKWNFLFHFLGGMYMKAIEFCTL
jgi:hypothetical protein